MEINIVLPPGAENNLDGSGNHPCDAGVGSEPYEPNMNWRANAAKVYVYYPDKAILSASHISSGNFTATSASLGLRISSR